MRVFTRIGIMMAIVMSSLLPNIKGMAQEQGDSVVRVTKASIPRPALRYQFWPELSQQKSISATPMFLRSIILMEQNGGFKKELDKVLEAFERGQWNDDVQSKAKQMISNTASILTEMERATDCMTISNDLNIRDANLPERIALLLPDVQESRGLARLLMIRGHLEAHEGRWDDFSRTCQSLFRLAEIVGHENAFIVGRLVRYSIIGVTLEMIERVSALEGCPNFYWALAAVPDRLFDMNDVIAWERQNSILVFGVDELPDEPIGAVAAASKLKKMVEVITEVGAYSGDTEIDASSLKLLGGIYLASKAEACRDLLKSEPKWKDRVDELSDMEAVLRANYHACQRQVDDFFCWSLLPNSIRGPFLTTKGVPEFDIGSPVLPADLTTRMLLPALVAVFRAESRLRNQMVDAINLQAIRAAGTDGLPKDKTDFPVPPWPSYGEQASPWYEPTSANTANWSRVDLFKPGKFQTVKVELQ